MRRQPSSGGSTSISTSSIQAIIEKLKTEQFRNSTKATYYRVWKLFCKFFIRLDDKLMNWEDRIVLFTGFLIENKLKSTTVRSYLSAIRAILWDCEITLNEDTCLLNALTRACKIKNDRLLTKLPMGKNMLKIVLTQNKVAHNTQVYLRCLFAAIHAAAYYGLFRIGEVVKGPHVILARNVHMAQNKKKLFFVLNSSKTHNQGDKLQRVKIMSTRLENLYHEHSTSNLEFCPFAIIKEYLSLRLCALTATEQFFVFPDNAPVTPDQLRSHLQKMVRAANLDPALYQFHGW